MSLNTITEGTIPDTIRDIEQWICWREDERDGKPTKVPIKPYRTSGTPFASATDPETWRDFETALTYHRESNSRTDGVGFVFDPEARIVGVDLDNCRGADSEEIEKWAADIVDRLDSYTEISPSGTGIHVLVKGELPPGRNRRGDVEIYDRDRFFTVTGSHVTETPQEVARRQDALLAVHHEFVQTTGDDETTTLTEATERAASNGASQDGDDDEALVDESAPVQPVGPNSGLRRKFGQDQPAVNDPALEAALHGLPPGEIPDPVPRTIDEIAGPGVDLSDSDILKRATASKSGETIQALLDGEKSLWSERNSRYPSQSEADMGLCFFLGFWTGGDPERIDELFRDSGLYREKWDRRHYGNGATYGAVCIARALLKLDDYYSPPAGESELPDTEPSRTASDSALVSELDPSPADTTRTQAIEDAKRLASKVQHQQRELQTQRERIAELETRLRWYRRFVSAQSENHSTEQYNLNPEESREVTPADPPPESPPRDEVDPPPGGEIGEDAKGTATESGTHEERAEQSEGVVDRFRRWIS